MYYYCIQIYYYINLRVKRKGRDFTFCKDNSAAFSAQGHRQIAQVKRPQIVMAEIG